MSEREGRKPVATGGCQCGAVRYAFYAPLDHPESAPISKQFGTESRLPWVRFCEDVPGERTGESAAAQEFLAKMQDQQSHD